MKNVLKVLFWVIALWCFLVKGFLYCIIWMVVAAPLLLTAFLVFLAWKSGKERKEHPKKYKNEKSDNFVYME